jgi:CDP-glycerol glycerophosphotransferase (TagB/SpsB family)
MGEDSLSALGLLPGVPIILWAPTYRGTAGAKGWVDSAHVDAFATILADGGKALREAAVGSGRQMALRPHPRDQVTFAHVRFPVLTDDVLQRVGANFYSFLPDVACLVTDYSSIWTDFLLLDRPIAFYCPDLVDYGDGRGLAPGFEGVVPGPLFESDAEFLAHLSRGSMDDERQREQRRLAKKAIGLVESLSPAEELVRWALTYQAVPRGRRT